MKRPADLAPRRKTSAALKPPRLDPAPAPAAYLDGHRVRPTERALRDGTRVAIRLITPEDEARMVAFHATLSDESVHARYFGMRSLAFRTEHERLARLCGTDLAREVALVVDRENAGGEHEILGVGRLIRTPGRNEAEFAVLVGDRWQGEGLGAGLLSALVRIARDARVRIFGHVLPGNAAMLHVIRAAGFELRLHAAEGEWVAELDFRPGRTTRIIPAPV